MLYPINNISIKNCNNRSTLKKKQKKNNVNQFLSKPVCSAPK